MKVRSPFVTDTTGQLSGRLSSVDPDFYIQVAMLEMRQERRGCHVPSLSAGFPGPRARDDDCGGKLRAIARGPKSPSPRACPDQYFSQQQYREAIIEYRNVLEGPQSIRYTARAGDLKPLHSSSIGKALLGALGQDELPEVLKQLPLDRVTEATITDRSALLTDLERSRQRDYFVTTGENVADVMAVAATVRLGSDVYGIAIAGPIHRMTDNLTRHVSALSAACATITDMTHERAALQRRS